MSLPYNVPDGQVLRTPHIIGSNIGPARVIGSGAIRSENYAAGSTGWSIDGDGNVEFNDGTFRGDIVGSTISIGTSPNWFRVDSSGNMWLGGATFPGTFGVANSGDVTIDGNVTLDADGVFYSDTDLPRIEIRHSNNPYTPGEATLVFRVTDSPSAVAHEAQIRTNAQELMIQGPANTLGGQLASIRLSDPLDVATLYAGAEKVTVDGDALELIGDASFVCVSNSNEVLDLRNQWDTYTTTWSASVTNPTLGNGTLDAKYFRIGTWCQVHIRLVTGTTSTAGSGTWRWAFPFAALNTWPTGGARRLGMATIYDNAGTIGIAYVVQDSADHVRLEYVNGAGMMNSIGTVGHATPIVWSAGDVIDIFFSYEIAA